MSGPDIERQRGLASRVLPPLKRSDAAPLAPIRAFLFSQ